MNRSILIVICDFLVSAMLSMTTGMVAPGNSPGIGGGRGMIDNHTIVMLLDELHARQRALEQSRAELLALQQQKGFSAEREAKLKAMALELAGTRAKAEALAQKVSAQRENRLGKVSPAELQARLDREIKNRHLLRIQFDENKQQLEYLRGSLRTASGDLVKAAENVAVTKQQLADTRAQLKEREAKLDALGIEIGGVRATLAEREQSARQMRRSLDDLIAQGGVVRQRSRQLESDLSFAKGKLSATERDLAETRDVAERSRKLAAQRELERSEAVRRLENMQRMLKTAVTDLSQTRTELRDIKKIAAATGQELASAKGSLETTAAKLSAAEEKLRSDVLERYSAAAARLKLDVVEEGMLMDFKGGGDYFYPVVKLDGKTVLIGGLRDLAGTGTAPLAFEKIIKLQYQVSAAKSDKPVAIAAGPLFAIPDEPRAAALEVVLNNEEIKPLEVITRGELKTRGVHDLFLFKIGSFGKNSTSLGGRCSLDLANDDGYLFIRNGGRIAVGELRADVGDLVLTKQGELVGVVVDTASSQLGRKQEAKCFIFPDRFRFDHSRAIPLNRRSGEPYYKDFGKAVAAYLRAGEKR